MLGLYGAVGYGAYGEIESARSKASEAATKARNAEVDVARLARRLDQLTLTCQAMWELLRDNTEVTEDDLRAKISEVDLRDGKANGKVPNVLVDCTSCRRPTNTRRQSCLYCGESVRKIHAFDS